MVGYSCSSPSDVRQVDLSYSMLCGKLCRATISGFLDLRGNHFPVYKPSFTTDGRHVCLTWYFRVRVPLFDARGAWWVQKHAIIVCTASHDILRGNGHLLCLISVQRKWNQGQGNVFLPTGHKGFFPMNGEEDKNRYMSKRGSIAVPRGWKYWYSPWLRN